LLFGVCFVNISNVVTRIQPNTSVFRRCSTMAKCDVCGKGAHFGIKVSHSHRRSNRIWKSNVKNVRCIVEGTPKKLHVCTSCLRSNRVERA
jgi:large subunit ribosomal protein L28